LLQMAGVFVLTGGTYNFVPATRMSLIKQLALRSSSLPMRYCAARLSSVSPDWMLICVTQPKGGRHESGGAAVFTNVGVIVTAGDSRLSVGINVGASVNVAVTGTGDAGMMFVGVGVASGLKPTSEMDRAPTINPMEIRATTSAFPKSRKFRIISSL
jgi:hypothetical protein